MYKTPLPILGSGAFGKCLKQAARQAVCWGRQFPLDGFLQEGGIALLALPAQQIRAFLPQLIPFSLKGLVIASKGMERATGLLLSEVVQEVMGSLSIGILSGPNLAQEIMQGQWAGTVLATTEAWIEEKILAHFQGGPLHIHVCRDVIGVQVSGALKNVMAIGYGFLQQLGAGDNMRATYLVKAMEEIKNFGIELGGKEETFWGYAGIGDLILTCTSMSSRNALFGRTFQAPTIPEQPLEKNFLVEGRFSAKAVMCRAKDKSLYPLMHNIDDIIQGVQPLQKWTDIVEGVLNFSCGYHFKKDTLDQKKNRCFHA